MSVIAGNSLSVIYPVELVSVYMARLEGVSGNKSEFLFPALESTKKSDSSLDKPASYTGVFPV